MAWGVRNLISTQVLAARCFRRAGRPGLVMAMALLRATVGLLRVMATRHPTRDTAILHRNRATRRPASASRRRASRATRSCRKVVLRRGRPRATAVADPHRLTRRTPSRAARPLRTRRIHNKAVKHRRTRLTLSNKRRRARRRSTGHRRPRASTAVLLRVTEARRLSNTAVRLPRATVRLRPRASSTVRLAARPRKGNNTARRRQLLRRRTMARPPTRLAPTARRLGPQGRRIEFAETIIPTFAETYRDTL